MLAFKISLLFIHFLSYSGMILKIKTFVFPLKRKTKKAEYIIKLASETLPKKSLSHSQHYKYIHTFICVFIALTIGTSGD